MNRWTLLDGIWSSSIFLFLIAIIVWPIIVVVLIASCAGFLVDRIIIQLIERRNKALMFIHPDEAVRERAVEKYRKSDDGR